MAITSKFFSENEFKSASPPCSLQNMEQYFMVFMDNLRTKVGKPLRFTSAYRSVEHEKKMGRTGNSAHTEGKAMDISTPDSVTRFQVVKAAIELGCKRIGINFEKNFVHLDTSDKLDKNVMWKY